LPAEIVCLQASLAYDNARENWITRQCAIEYASLFGALLPFFSAARLPLPLGGTSNHFRMKALRAVGAWDPYNVTEDADLGLRLARCNYGARMLASTTFEEAPCHAGVWMSQRTRWLKGWMQTYGVHMRNPVALFRSLGLKSFLTFQIYFAGIILSALLHPIFYLLLAYDLLSGGFGASGTLPARILYGLAAMNFFGGYLGSGLLAWAGLREGRNLRLLPHLALFPAYWLLISAAAYRAAWQLTRAPFFWEKTPHGLSKTPRTNA
jgi:cellulose synthase/poly-beta-1,6-N-acetylglucosamine synthase-like glycosyltransferase